MKRLAAVVAAALVLSLAAIAFVPSVLASTSMPTWSAGDYWVYKATGNGTGPVPIAGSGSTIRYDVVGSGSTTVGSSTISAYDTKVNFTVTEMVGSTPFNFSITGDEWFRTSDLAPAKLSLSASVMGYSISITASYSPPPDIHWPLNTGDTWTITSTVSLSMNFLGISNTTSDTEVVNQTVLADTSVTVVAGTFATTPLKQTIGSSSEYSVMYWSASAGNMVSQRSYDSSGSQTGSLDLQSYHYSGGLTFLGLSIFVWIGIVAAIVIIAVAVVLLRRRRRPKAPMPMPPGVPPQQGPPGEMPPSPPPGPP